MAFAAILEKHKHRVYHTYSAEAKNVQSATYPDTPTDTKNVYYT
jgi:hypothetical protein